MKREILQQDFETHDFAFDNGVHSVHEELHNGSVDEFLGSPADQYERHRMELIAKNVKAYAECRDLILDRPYPNDGMSGHLPFAT